METAKSHAWAADALVTLGVGAVLGSLSVSAAQGIVWSGRGAAVVVTAFVVLHLTVAGRTRAPASAYALASLAMLAIALTPDGRVADPAKGGLTGVPALFLPSSLVFLVVLYGAAARLRGLSSRAALVIALAGAAAASARTAHAFGQVTADSWLVRGYLGLALAVAVLVTWSLGRLALVRRGRAATERVESARLAVLEERARIAREMHDIVAHSLAVIVRQAEGGAYVAERAPDQAAQSLRTIAETGRAALADMRGLLGILRDPDGQSAHAPQPTLADLPPLVSGVRESGIAAELTEVGAPFALGPATELAAFRLVQEALTNAVKYAGPRARVEVRVQWRAAEVAIDVTDDGGERGAAPPVPGAGAGLQGLRERVSAVGGTLRADRLERGFHVQASFPRPVEGASI